MPLIGTLRKTVLRQSHDDGEVGLTCSHTASSSSMIEDIDAADQHMYESIVEYVSDVVDDLRQKETKQHAALCAMSHQIESDRAKLLDWMLELRHRLSLRVDTYALAVGLLDRYVSSVLRRGEMHGDPIVTIEHAAGAMMLAATLEETFPPETTEMVWLCRKAVEQKADRRLFYDCGHATLRTTSWKMASALDFDLWTTTWLHFLRRFSKASRSTKAQHDKAKAICSAMLEKYSEFVLCYRPSQLAAAAVMKTRMLTMPTQKEWNKTLAHYTGYSREEIAAIVNKMTF